MNAAKSIEIIESLVRQGASLRVQGGRLECVGVVDEALLQQVRDHEAALISLLKARGRAALDSSRPPPINHGPLSPAQLRLWAVQQIHPESTQYNIVSSRNVSGPLDLSILHQALMRVVARQETLRTVFAVSGGEVRQIVRAAVESKILFHDLRDAPGDVQKKIDGLSAEHFDLASGPLFHVMVLQTGVRAYTLVLAIHHLICDGWSIELFFKELVGNCDDVAAGRPPKSPLRLTYLDHLLRKKRQTMDPSDELAFWREYLKGVPALTTFPLEGPRRVQAGQEGATVKLRLDAVLTSKLHTLAKNQQATLFMVLLSAFKLLLFAHTRQADTCVGVPFAARTDKGLGALIGYLATTVPIRTTLAPDAPIEEFIAAVKASAMAAFSHPEVPLEIFGDDMATRVTGAPPVFQTLFCFHSEKSLFRRRRSSSTFKLGPPRQHTAPARYDLSLDIYPVDSGLFCSFEFDPGLLFPQTVERFAAEYASLLAALANQTPLTAGELCASIVPMPPAWFAKGPQIEIEAMGVHQLIERQALASPSKIAVKCAGRTLTFAELDADARKLASRLQRLGVASGGRVGVALERSVELVVCLLAIHKIGAAFIAIDPAYPPARKHLILHDAQPCLVLTAQPLGIEYSGAMTLDDVMKVEGVEVLVDEAPPEETASSLAYIVYTSGSTGRPKGVMVEHRSVINLVASVTRTLRFTTDDVLLSSTLPSFDLGCLDVFLPLCNGATLLLTSDSGGIGVADALTSEFPTIFQATPAMWRVLDGVLRSRTTSRLPALRVAVCGGEQWDASLHGFLSTIASEVWNFYGPTETTVWSTCARIHHGEKIVLGAPLDNTSVQVRLPSGGFAGKGETGELLIGGAGLARGYFNADELTAQRFVWCPSPDSYAAVRLYLTGDIVRVRNDGAIEYVCRVDRQVKVHGHRIELEEIETVIRAHPCVVGATVVPMVDEGVVHQLGACIATAQPLAAEELREYLLRILPGNMVPTTILVRERLPLNEHGKTDVVAVAREVRAAQMPVGARVPRDEKEAAIVAVAKQVLGHPEIGIDDNFFRLGGHSLLAVTFMLKAELRGLHITPVEVLTTNSFADLARSARWRSAQALPLPAGPTREVELLQNHAYAVHEIGSGASAAIQAAFITELVPRFLTREDTARLAEKLERRFDVMGSRYDKVKDQLRLCPCDLPIHHRVRWKEASLPDIGTGISSRRSTLDPDYLTRVGVYRLHCVAEPTQGHSLLHLEIEARTVDKRSMRILQHWLREGGDAESSPAREATYAAYARSRNATYADDPEADGKQVYWMERASSVDWLYYRSPSEARSKTFTGRGTRYRWRFGAKIADLIREAGDRLACSPSALLCAASSWAILEATSPELKTLPVRIYNEGVDAPGAEHVVGPLGFFYYIVAQRRVPAHAQTFLATMITQWAVALMNSRTSVRNIWKPVPSLPDRSFSSKSPMTFLYETGSETTPDPRNPDHLKSGESSKTDQECIVAARLEQGALHLSLNLYEHCLFELQAETFLVAFVGFLQALAQNGTSMMPEEDVALAHV